LTRKSRGITKAVVLATDVNETDGGFIVQRFLLEFGVC